jgi:hypothetical protein
MKMASAAPAAKVWAAALTALLVPILMGLLKKYAPELPLPVDANDLAQQVVEGAILGVLTFAAGYFKRPNPTDVAVPDAPLQP